MNTLSTIATKIIKEQALIVGPIAWLEAGKVPGLNIVDKNTGVVSIEGSDGGSVVDRLVSQYENLFGLASREVCREAAAPLVADLSPGDIPVSLR